MTDASLYGVAFQRLPLRFVAIAGFNLLDKFGVRASRFLTIKFTDLRQTTFPYAIDGIIAPNGTKSARGIRIIPAKAGALNHRSPLVGASVGPDFGPL